MRSTAASRRPSQESVVSRLSLPPRNDPNIARAIESSVLHSRASSLHNLSLSDKEGKDKHPFRRWVATLHKRSAKKRKEVRPREERWSLDEFDNEPAPASSKEVSGIGSRHRKSLSWASGSSALVASTRTALLSLSTLSETPNSSPGAMLPRLSRRSGSEKNSGSLDYADDGSRERAIKRGHAVDEIVASEVEYISALKALLSVYSNVQATASESLKSDMGQMQRIIQELLGLHDELLGSLRRLKRKSRATVEADEAAQVAMLFGAMMSRFFVYEEYGAKYEDMLRNMAVASKNIPNWESYQRGFETLTNSVAPNDHCALSKKKSLTFGDLHIKPIQRVCKYPLLFADLCKHTPVIDGPDAHFGIEKVLFRLRETVKEINEATSEGGAREKIQRSWKLQDMLLFPEPLMAPQILRSLGHAMLCGALYVVYQSERSVLGEHMMCVLFRSCLLLAVASLEAGKTYRVVATISRASLALRDVNDGLGLQCSTAPFAWKVMFEADQKVFELVLCACSQGEEQRWKRAMRSSSGQEAPEPDGFSTVNLNIKSIGDAIGKPGSLLRRMAMQETAPNGRQVVIKNVYLEPSRGASLSMRDRIATPILVARRSDRVRMEEEMAEVWTRECLPFPGVQRPKQIRASASSMLRKLSRSGKSRLNMAL